MEGRNQFAIMLADFIGKKELTLREISRRSGYDAGNLSKLERGQTIPPRDLGKLSRVFDALELSDDERRRLSDAAMVAAGSIPNSHYLRSNVAIPTLLRAIENRQLSAEQVEKLAEIIQTDSEVKEM